MHSNLDASVNGHNAAVIYEGTNENTIDHKDEKILDKALTESNKVSCKSIRKFSLIGSETGSNNKIVPVSNDEQV